MHGSEQATGILHDLTDEDRRTLTRTFAFSAAIVLLGTVLLASVPFRTFAAWSRPNAARLALFLVPQALPVSIPVGLTFGILVGLGRAAAPRRARALVLVIAGLSSMASFAMLAWVVPVSNQAFRVTASGRAVMKGANELTLGELGRLREAKAHEPMAAPNEIRSLALNYHTRWAFAGAPFVLSFFAVALTHRRRRGRLMLGFVGCAAIFGYYAIMYKARALGLDRTLPTFVAAWIPNAAFLILSAAVSEREMDNPFSSTRGSLQCL